MAHNGNEIKDFIKLREGDIEALRIKLVNCDFALRIFGVTYRKMERSELRERKFRKRKFKKFLDRAYKNNWEILCLLLEKKILNSPLNSQEKEQKFTNTA